MVHKSNQGSPDSAELQTSSVINISTGTVHQELHGMVTMAKHTVPLYELAD